MVYCDPGLQPIKGDSCVSKVDPPTFEKKPLWHVQSVKTCRSAQSCQSVLGTLRTALDPRILKADSNDTDQIRWMCRLISVLAGPKSQGTFS